MKILVTGGAGYIGSHTCMVLSADGFTPIAYDNLSRGNRWAVQWGPLEVGELADVARLREVLRRYRPAAVVHFAAYAYVGESVENPLLYYENNIVGSTGLLRAVMAEGAIPVVFSSSCATYGNPDATPISEEHPQRPINPYGFSKLAVERMLQDLQSQGLRSISLRYFNVAGADPQGRIGEVHDPEPHLIPRVLAAAQNGTAVTVYGTDYPTPDGTCIRDYVHVVDVADAHHLALAKLLDGGGSATFNLANTRGFSVLDVVHMAKRVTGRNIIVEPAKRRPGDPAILVGSAERARACLGWVPKRSGLDSQITDAWNWTCKGTFGR